MRERPNFTITTYFAQKCNCKLRCDFVLVESLKKLQIQAEYTNFPARETEIGKLINGYLTSKVIILTDKS